jgi:ATP-dependent helicase/nuclease subunit A
MLGGERRLTDWNGMLDLVQLLERGSSDVSVVSRRLKQMIDAEVDVPRPILEAGNAISLLTLHASKGLEWPVVVLPDLATQADRRMPAALFNEEFGVVLTPQDVDGEKLKPALWKVMDSERRNKEVEELNRLYYVGITRARDHVILSTPKDSGPAWGQLSPGFAAAEISILTYAYVPADGLHPVPAPVPSARAPALGNLTPLGPCLADIPVTGLCDYEVCPRKFRYLYIEGHPGLGEETTHARAIGILTHWALQTGCTDIDIMARRALELGRPQVEEALRLATAARTNAAFEPVLNRITDRERPVVYECQGLVLHGIIDALGADFVLDYKTDKVPGTQTHDLQLWAYAQAARVPRAYVAYLRHDMLHEYTPDQLKSAGSRALGLLQRIQQSDFEATPSEPACRHCIFSPMCPERAVAQVPRSGRVDLQE